MTNDELKKLDNLAQMSARILFRASTVFPFHLFPSEIVIDENQVSIIDRNFFKVATINSIVLTDIKSVIVNTSTFFGSLTLNTLMPNSQPFTLEYLWRSEAMEARRIIQGLIVARTQKIDLSKISTPDILSRVNTIGSST